MPDGSALPERIFRIGIVVNELGEIREEIDLQLERLGGGGGRHVLAILAVGRRGFGFTAAEAEIEGVFPLLGQALRIDVAIPGHERGRERVRHFADG